MPERSHPLAAVAAALRPAWRAVRRAPAHALAVVLTLALGIGLAAGTGVVARAIAFAGLPVRDAERVLVLWGVDRAGTFPHLPIGPSEMPALTEAMRGVATIAAGDYNGANPWPFAAPDGDGPPMRLRGTLAGGTYFDVLGARPLLGRALRPEDDVIGAPRVMVLSHAAWRRHFGGDPSVVGRSFRSVTWGASYTVVGVMPPGLDVPRGVEFWTAFAPTAAVDGTLAGSPFAVDVVARLAPGATAEQAQSVLTRYYETLVARRKSHYAGARATARTLPELVTGDVRPAFTALAAAAAVVLLVTCGNVAGLLLVRAAARRRELAVRAAIGAGRARLVRDLVAEHALLAAAGGALGALLAAGLVRAFAALAPAELPRIADLAVDGTLLVAVVAATSVVVLAVGVGPALLAARVAPAQALGGAREGAGGRASDVRARRVLVGAQVALALVVVAGAALVGRSLAHLSALDLGLARPARLAFFELVPSADAARGEGGDPATAATRWRDRQEAILARVRAAPGVVAATPVVHAPFAGAAGWDGRVGAEGAAPDDSTRRPYVNMEVTDAEYLRTTGVPLLAGRWLGPVDREGVDRVAVVSERTARALYPDGGPRGAGAVGRRVELWGRERATIVGVVADARYRDFLEPRPSIFFAARQFERPAHFLAVRTRDEPTGVAGVVRRAVEELAPTMLVQPHGTLEARLAEPLARPRLLAAVLGAYGATVVVLTVAGLYAVVASGVTRRRRELGVRASLGATPRALARLVLGEGLRVAAIGAAVGLVLALAGSRLVAALLVGVSPTDPATLAVATLALLGVCAAAALVPARRAGRADPAAVLRAE